MHNVENVQNDRHNPKIEIELFPHANLPNCKLMYIENVCILFKTLRKCIYIRSNDKHLEN